MTGGCGPQPASHMHSLTVFLLGGEKKEKKETSTNTVSYALKQRLRGDREGFVQLLSVGETEALVWSLLDYFRMKTEMRQELFKVSKSF